MLRHRKARAAFTLVELLTVIAILVLLISMLLPVMGRAKELARLTVCRNNMRLLGEAGQGFAAQHEGRGPGRAQITITNMSSVSWAGILNTEFYKANLIQRMGYTPAKGKIYCPSMKWWGSLYPRAYKWNLDATGGPSWGGNSFEGPYGKLLPNGYHASPVWDLYALGAFLHDFPSPSTQFLASEGERGNDNCPSGTATPPYGVTLGDDPDHPAWSALSGQAAFRHLLPTGVRPVPQNYQGPARANYVYIDGHVETLGPNDRVNARDRFAYR